jgi:hypothetical protein
MGNCEESVQDAVDASRVFQGLVRRGDSNATFDKLAFRKKQNDLRGERPLSIGLRSTEDFGGH